MFWTFFKFKGQNRKNIAKLTARVSPYMKIMFQSLLVFITAINLRNVAETIVVYLTSSCVIWAFFGMSGPV
jgi:hypothetical protein